MIILATVWKNPLDEKRVLDMIDNGVNILRIKYAHTTQEEILEAIRKVQQLIHQSGKKVSVMVDLPEQKVRLGGLSNKKENVEKEKLYTVKIADTTETIKNFIPIQLPTLANYFCEGEINMIGDGELSWRVEKILSETEMNITFIQSGELCQYRGVSGDSILKHLDHAKPVFESLHLFKDIFPEYIALSFVSNAEFVTNVRQKIQEMYGDTWKPKIMAKIESPLGLENLETITKVSDIIVVARGDLALTTDYHRIILEQKRMCKVGQQYNVPVIVATQILDTAIDNIIPSRADLADLTNIVLDGASGIWLCRATAHNEQPGRVIRIAREIMNAVNS